MFGGEAGIEIENEIKKLMKLEHQSDKEYINQEMEKECYQIPPNVKQDITGDPYVVNAIKRSSMFGDMVNQLKVFSEGNLLDVKMGLNVTETSVVELSADEAESLYKDLCEQKELENDIVVSLLSTDLGIALDMVLPGSSIVLGALTIIGSAVTQTTPDEYDLDDELGGTYTVSTFTMEADWDIPGINWGKHPIQKGVIIYGDPIILDDGTVIENPLTTIMYY